MSGLTNYGATALLASTALPSPLYVRLHTADPGADGTDNACAEETRQAITLEPGADTNTAVNDAAATWTGLAATETSTYFTLWDAATDGNPWMVGEWGVDVDLTAAGEATVEAGNIRVDMSAQVHGA